MDKKGVWALTQTWDMVEVSADPCLGKINDTERKIWKSLFSLERSSGSLCHGLFTLCVNIMGLSKAASLILKLQILKLKL